MSADIAACPGCGRSFTRDAKWKLMCRPCYLRVKRAQERWYGESAAGTRAAPPPPPAPLALDASMLRLLLQLCHPDKHGSSKAATRATQYLLALRERHREGEHA